MTTYIDYTDNRSLLELLLNVRKIYIMTIWTNDDIVNTQRPMGLLALLDEESKFPKATDVTLAIKLHKNFSTSDYYTKPKDNGPAFIISHYAGPVSVHFTRHDSTCYL
jgi:myosin heavy subunit